MMAVRYVPPFQHVMELYIYEDYKEKMPAYRGRELTDMLIKASLKKFGADEAGILRDKKGKPFIADEDIYISVSHSGNYFVCLIAEYPVGVDVQQARKVDINAVSDRFFTEEEARYVDKNGADGFFVLWTRKEAYAKYTGLGLEEIMKGTTVLGRGDVEFTDFKPKEGIYGSWCRGV